MFNCEYTIDDRICIDGILELNCPLYYDKVIPSNNLYRKASEQTSVRSVFKKRLIKIKSSDVPGMTAWLSTKDIDTK